ncbi:MAG: transcriptional repressor [Bacteroidota bacterium]
MKSSTDILRQHNIRVTHNREKILDVFLNFDSALTEREIEHAVTTNCDRVTIYRTLTTFLDKCIIHKVLDNTGAMRYALCALDCGEGSDNSRHNHIHFKCTSCGKTKCLNHISMPSVEMPAGYSVQEVNVLFQGVCEKCSRSSSTLSAQ